MRPVCASGGHGYGGSLTGAADAVGYEHARLHLLAYGRMPKGRRRSNLTACSIAHNPIAFAQGRVISV